MSQLPSSKDVNMEAEEYPLLGSDTSSDKTTEESRDCNYVNFELHELH